MASTTGPEIDYEDKKYAKMKAIQEDCTLDNAQFKSLCKEAKDFVKTDMSVCESIPRRFSNTQWKDFSARFAKTVGPRFWSETRNGYKKGTDLAWPQHKEQITFFCFSLMRFEAIKHLTIVRKERGLVQLEEEKKKNGEAATKKGKNEAGDGSDPVTEDSEDYSPAEALTGEQVGKKNIHKGDPFGAARAAHRMEESDSLTHPGDLKKRVRPDSLLAKSAAAIENTTSIDEHFSMSVEPLDAEALKQVRGRASTKKKRAAMEEAKQLSAPTEQNKNGNGVVDSKESSAATEAAAHRSPGTSAADEEDNALPDIPKISVRTPAKLMFKIVVQDPRGVWGPATPFTSSVTKDDDDDEAMPDAEAEAEAEATGTDGDVKEAMPTEPPSKRAKISRSMTPVPSPEVCLINSDSTISWMDFFGRVNMFATDEQKLALPRTTQCMVRGPGWGQRYTISYRARADVDVLWAWVMRETRKIVHAKLNALIEEGEYYEPDESDHGEVTVNFF